MSRLSNLLLSLLLTLTATSAFARDRDAGHHTLTVYSADGRTFRDMHAHHIQITESCKPDNFFHEPKVRSSAMMLLSDTATSVTIQMPMCPKVDGSRSQLKSYTIHAYDEHEALFPLIKKDARHSDAYIRLITNAKGTIGNWVYI